jgi:hypothetical protein
MNTEFTAVIQTLVAEQGKEALLNAAKCKALLADYTRGEYKKESRLLLQALEAGVTQALNNTDDITSCKAQAVRKLQDEYFLAENIAADVVDMLALVLAVPKAEEAAASATAKCANCGKELQEAWKACPFCGAGVKPEVVIPSTEPAQSQPVIQPAPISQPQFTSSPQITSSTTPAVDGKSKINKAGLISFVLSTLFFIIELPIMFYMIRDGWFSPLYNNDFLIGLVPLSFFSLLSLFFGIRAIRGKNRKFRLAGIRISIINIVILLIGSLIGFF